MHHDVGRIERRQLLEKPADIALGVVIADAAIEYLRAIATVVEHAFEAGLDGVFFWHAPAERDRAAEKENPSLAVLQRADLRAAKSKAVQANFSALQQCALRAPVIEIDLRVVAFLFELVGIAPHLDVVVRHRAIFDAQERLGRQQTQHERNSKEQYREKRLANGTDPVLGIGRSHD